MFRCFLDDWIDNYSVPVVKGKHSICEPLLIIAAYMIFVRKIGPRLMENRKPFDIQKWVVVFDAFQVIFNFYLVVTVTKVIFVTPGSFFCLELDSPDSSNGKQQLFLTIFYYWLKVSDLLDTVFFVLRKSWRQVTYLHVYHHALMVLASWMAIKLAPGGHCAYFGLTNAFVHTVMYTYYLLSAYDSSWKRNIQLKKLVTQIQLIQFMFLFVMFFPTLFNSCSLSPVVGIAATTQSVYFLYLFGKFYYNTYVKPNTGKRPIGSNHQNDS